MDASDDSATVRARVEAIAREYIGTPFHDHGEVKGAGVDCATFLKCVFVDAGVIAPFTLDHYSPQFFLHQKEERYIGWVKRFAREIDEAAAKPGDIVLYHIEKCFAHGALIVEPGWPSIIHAHFASRKVRADNGLRPRLGTAIKGTKFFRIKQWRD